MTERRLLLVDFKNQAYRATAAHSGLFSGRVFTGGLYGFLVALCSAIRFIGATTVVCATDLPPYKRSRAFKEYKGDRTLPDDEEHKILVMKGSAAMAQIKQVCELLGIPVWGVEGFEFDDVCAWATTYHRQRYSRIAAMANDSDLYQLFDVPAFCIYKGAKQGIYDRASFVEEFGELSRDQWIDVLSMTGTHNAVPGVDGIGPKTALKAVRDRARLRVIMDKHGDVIERNRELIRLPYAGFPSRPMFDYADHSSIVLRDFARFCARFDIQTTSGMLEALQDLRNNGR